MLQKFPINEVVFQNAKCINVQRRSDAKWESFEFFVTKFNSVFTAMDRLYDEFCDYKILKDEKLVSIPGMKLGDNELFHYIVDIYIVVAHDEFCDYKTLKDVEVGIHTWNEAKVNDGSLGDNELSHYRVETLWWHIGQSQGCP